MSTEFKSRTIAVLAVDGENFSVNGFYADQDRNASWYTITRSRDGNVIVDKCTQFPTHESIRELIH
tara:strand:+ start:72 stop:269 length:198 start_codon:yes stop_codon:yes gene_type:complete